MSQAASLALAWIGTIAFLTLAPGVIAGLIPWLISGWRWYDLRWYRWGGAAWIVVPIARRSSRSSRGHEEPTLTRTCGRAVLRLPTQCPRVAAAAHAVACVTARQRASIHTLRWHPRLDAIFLQYPISHRVADRIVNRVLNSSAVRLV